MVHTVISLFSGAGFLDFGFTETGYDIIWGSELVPIFAQVHNYNLKLRYGENKKDIIQIGDITAVDIENMPKARGIIGGPPCQDFSVGNSQNPGVSGERGRLVWDYFKKVVAVQPDFFVFENVEGLYRIKKNRYEALLPLLEQFDSLGYEVYFKTLNALEFGIPQNRNRIFIVGFKKSITNSLRAHGLDVFSWPTPIYPNARKAYEWPASWEFGTVVDEEEYIDSLNLPYCLTAHSVIGDESELEKLPNHVAFRPRSHKFHFIEEGDDRRKSFKRLHRFKYSPTAAYGNNEVHLHPTKARRLSVREALRIQSVPDWYHFEEGIPLDRMFKMVSNGVPTRLAEMIAIQVSETLNLYDSLATVKQLSIAINE